MFARLAIVDVLKRGSKEISAPWENPSSGAHGTVTPIASAYDKDGGTCRDFLASYVRRQGSETWLQGEACRPGRAPDPAGLSSSLKSGGLGTTYRLDRRLGRLPIGAAE